MLLLGVRVVLPEDANPVLSGGMKETLEGLSGLNVTVTRIDVVHRTDPLDASTETVVVIDNEIREIPLIGNLSKQAPRQIAFLNVPEGYVTQVRLITSDAEITLREDTYPVDIPSGQQTGLKIEPIDGEPFKIVENDRTSIRVVLNPYEQLIRNKGQGFKLKPVLRAEHITLEELSPIIMDRVLVKFKDNATTEQINFVISEQYVETLEFDVTSKFIYFGYL